MKDRQTTPDFKEDRVFDQKEVNDIAMYIHEDLLHIIYDYIEEFESDMSDYDREQLGNEIINQLKNRL